MSPIGYILGVVLQGVERRMAMLQVHRFTMLVPWMASQHANASTRLLVRILLWPFVIVSALLIAGQVVMAQVQQISAGVEERPAVFLGNESLPPMNFMKDGRPAGVVVDLVGALAKRMHRPVEIRLTNWSKAQELVLEGRADALLQINPSPERLQIYDFSEPLLSSEFTIFTSSDRSGVYSMRNLRGLKVGVEEKGLPILLLQQDPQIIVQIIPDFIQGFRMLATGSIDAVVADRWVGRYVLAENNIQDVKSFDEPIGQSHSAIAVKKGNTSLLGDINAALADIRRDGTYEKIIKFWQPKEVVFKTREQLEQQASLTAVISVALIVSVLSLALLVIGIRRGKRTELALRESEERLRLFIQHAPASLAMYDRNMRYISFSSRWLKDYNLGERELKGLSHYEVFPEISEEWKDIHRRALAGEVVRAEDDQFDRADGSVQWLRWEVRPWYDHSGKVGGIVIFSEDITARKLAEEALRASERRLIGVLESMPDAFVSFDADMRYTYVNANAERLQAAHREELLGKDVRAVYTDVESRKTISEYEWAIREQKPVTSTSYHAGFDSWVEIRAFPTPDGVSVFYKDVSAQVKAEQALRASEEQFRVLTQNLQSAVALIDEHGAFSIVNSSFLGMFDIPQDATILNVNSRDWAQWQVFDEHGALLDVDEHPVRKAALTRTAVRNLLVAVKSPSSPDLKWLLVSAEPILDEWGGIHRLICTYYDITEHKAAEEALRVSETKYRDLFENIEEMVTVYEVERDDSGRIVERRLREANRAFLRAVGVSSVDDIRGKTSGEISGKVWSERHLPAVQKAMDTGQVQVQEIYRPESGRHFITSVVRLDTDTYLSTGRDITERKQAEEELKRTRNTLAEAQKVAHLGSFEYVAASRTTVWSEEQYRIYGLDPAGPSPAYDVMLEKCIYPDDAALLHETFAKAMQSRSVYELEHRIVRPDGSVRWVYDRANPYLDEDGNLLRYIGATLDITARKLMEEELRKSRDELEMRVQKRTNQLAEANRELMAEKGKLSRANELLQTVFDGISDPLLMLDKDCRIRMLNEAARKYFQIADGEDPSTKTCRELSLEKGGICGNCAVTGAISRGEGLTIERSGIFDAQLIEEVTVYPLDEADGGFSGAIMRISDITETKNMEKHLTRADRLSSLGQLAGGIAHEIRNPLQGINLFVDVLSDEEKFSRTSQELGIFSEIKKSIKRMDGIIKRVLDFSRQPEATAMSNLNMQELIEDSLKLWQSRMMKDNIQLKLVIEESLPVVVGDSIEIEQVLANLIHNGIDAIGREGTLSIHARKGSLSFDVNRPAVIIAVQDSGPGIPLDQQKQIFYPFFTTKSTGTGLGLAISHRIISRHGGRISFKSTPGVGTTFIVELPAAPVR